MKNRALTVLAGLAVLSAVALAVPELVSKVGAQEAQALGVADTQQAMRDFNTTCAGCHGENALGGDRAPALAENAHLRTLDAAGIANIIRGGQRAMPPFPNLPPAELTRIAAWLHLLNKSGLKTAPPEQVAAGEKFFNGAGGCAGCHMVRGVGGSNGPDLSSAGQRLTGDEIASMLDDPTGQIGTKRTPACPGWAFCPSLEWTVANVQLRNGARLRGFLRNEAEHSLIVQTFDGHEHLLGEKDYVSYKREPQSFMPTLHATADQRRDLMAYLTSLGGPVLGPLAEGASASPAQIEAITHPRLGEWPAYNGGPNGNRYSKLDQINAGNVRGLKPAWIFSPGGTGLETTPVVVDGVMVVSGAQQVCALDAKTGLSIWCTPRTAGQAMRAGGGSVPTRGGPAGPPVSRPFGGVANGTGPNRGVAVLGDRVYVATDDAYMMCLNRLTGGVVWIVPMTDPKSPGLVYATTAPLVVGDLVVAGVSGTPGARGFLAAFKASSGEVAWRFFGEPQPGDPNAETWKGTAIANGGTGGAGAWMTGSYDPVAKLLYWGTANPDPSGDGDQREGRNLYANTILALEPKTGKVKWFYQTTPHDLHDWDATAPLSLVDTDYGGKPRKLLIQANRNGFFYVLDRRTGELLLAKPFVKKMTWASGIGPDGMPILLPGYAPTVDGKLTCPAVRGATNWFSASYNPGTDLYYVMAAEDCGFYRKTGRVYGPNPDFKDPGKRFLRALNIHTGALAWEKPLTGSNEANYSGVLSTAGNIVFHGETAGGFAAVNARDGTTLWSFPTNDSWRASPMTYLVDGKQYVAVAAGTNIIAFALGDGN